MTVTFALLGPLRAWRDGTEVDLGARQQRLMLALLLAHPTGPVGVHDFVDLLWGEDAPTSAVNSVHRYIGVLRRVLEPDLPTRSEGRWLVRSRSGYRLTVAPGGSDLLAFRAHAAEARTAAYQGDHATAARLSADALRLVHGPCAAGELSGGRRPPAFAAIDHEVAATARAAAEAALRAGQAGAMLTALRPIADLNPLDESLQAQLMLVLAADGKQSEAFALYERKRAVLAGELGVDPGSELQAAYLSVLRPQTGEPAAAGTVRPAQLPPDLSIFTGRADELAAAREVLTADGGAPVLAVDGMPGVGKTTFAIHLAHLLAPGFPDGQLHIDLNGFDVAGTPIGTGEAIRGFLNALGVRDNAVPAGIAAQTGMFRSLLAGRRVLIVLDNAYDVDQVRPLLPGTAGCAVIVTSRRRMTALAATGGARLLTLTVPTAAEAGEFLARRLGPERAAEDRAAADEIVAACARLPLALAVVAARAAAEPHFPLPAIAEELREADTDLGVFTDGGVDVRAAFSWSYRVLPEPAAALFRLLATHVGPDISLSAAAGLAGLPRREARGLLADLTQAHLVVEHQSRRYRFHDLVRAYATEKLTEDGSTDRQAASTRLLAHYRHSAYAMHLLLGPYWDPISPGAPPPGVVPEVASDRSSALAWFAAEHAVLSAAVQRATDEDAHTSAWQLALTLEPFYRSRGLWHDWAGTMRTALRAAQSSPDLTGQGFAHRSLAAAYHHLGHLDRARVHLENARRMFTLLGRDAEVASVHCGMASILRDTGDYEQSVTEERRALRMHVRAGHRRGQADALHGLATCAGRMGRREAAIRLFGDSLAIGRDSGDLVIQADCWRGLGDLYRRAGENGRAAGCLSRATDLYRAASNQAGAAAALLSLGHARLDEGRAVEARDAWTESLRIHEETRSATAAELRERLRRLPPVLHEFGTRDG
ncbi:BTAD domain-containing putative transcriptional regulator [Actinoplanes sp. NPDC049265]|uniref:AfsR/SARP family transcriptional regulator n=1 Tax=Actinoplanes sp. NPDC049265 TaxID=3363902 RepID=UPI0037134335